MYDDKREFPRFLFSEPVTYGLPEVPISGSVAGNISLGGISLKVQEFVPLGVVLELQIRLDQSSKVIWARAKVVWVRQLSSEDNYEIGLKFIRDEECARAIGRYINTRRSQLTS